MDQRERINDPHETFKLLLDGRQLRMWTALPGIIQKFYPDKQTVDVQPSIMGVVTDAGGNTKSTNLPKLMDCPVQFPSGGGGGTTGQQSVGGSGLGNNTSPFGGSGSGSLGLAPGGGLGGGLGNAGNIGGLGGVSGGTSSLGGLGGTSGLGSVGGSGLSNLGLGAGGLGGGGGIGGLGGGGLGGIGGAQQYGVTLTFPVQPGDECLIIFTSRGFDNWYQSGGIQPPMEARMHDLSDGFVILGFRSQPRKLNPSVSTTTCQLRSDDGKTLVELDAKNESISLRDNVAQNYIKLDIKNQQVGIVAQKKITLQDPSASNYIQFDVTNKNLNIVMQGQVTMQASQFNIKGPIVQSGGGITGSSDVSTSSGVTLNTHTHPDPQGGTVGAPQG